jgi:hypothetical protein
MKEAKKREEKRREEINIERNEYDKEDEEDCD